jgi:serine/threonine-protein kinase
VLYEMLTGRSPFAGDTVSDTLAAVLKTEIDWSALPRGTPPRLLQLLERCLDREPRRRLRDIGEARVALERGPIDEVPAAVAAALPLPPWKQPAAWTALAVVAVAAAALGAGAWARLAGPPAGAVTRLSIALPAGQVLAGAGGPAITRDGRTIAYVARDAAGMSRLYLRALDRFEPTTVPESEGATEPFFSPDGRRVGFFARGKLMTAALAGGAPTAIADAGSFPVGGSWGEDGAIVYVPALTSGLMEVASSGGEPRRLTQPDDGANGYAHTWPQVLPGGRQVFFTVWAGATVANRGGALLSLESGKWAHVLDGENQWGGVARYARSGHLLVSRSHGVIAAPFDPARPTVVRAESFVLDDVFITSSASISWFAVSDNGTLAYVPGDPSLGTFAWVDREGHLAPIAGGEMSAVDLVLSPDGTRVAFEDTNDTIWVVDLRRGSRTRLTFDGQGSNAYPIWARDGKHVVFSSNRGGDWDLYDVAAGGGPARRLLAQKGNEFASSQGPDGTILFSQRKQGTGVEVWALAPGGAAKPWLVSSFSTTIAEYSPDGRMLAYVSDETGREEVYVRTVAEPAEAAMVSTDGGREPKWSADGRELFFRRGDAFLAASVTLAGSPPSIAVGDPKALFEMRAAYGRSNVHVGYSVAPDGRGLFVQLLSDRALPRRIDVVENWFGELRAKVPPR